MWLRPTENPLPLYPPLNGAHSLCGPLLTVLPSHCGPRLAVAPPLRPPYCSLPYYTNYICYNIFIIILLFYIIVGFFAIFLIYC